MSIQRYYPEVKYTVRETRVNMAPHERGSYVTYESHAEELRRVEAELAALKAMQKSDFFYHLKPMFEKAFEEAIDSVVKQATQTVLMVNTEALISADVARWMEKHMNERAGFATGGLYVGEVKSDINKMNDALLKARAEHYVICTGAEEGSHFTKGVHYAYDRHECGLIRICQDDLVSDLAEDDCWIAESKRNPVDGQVYYFLQGHSQGKKASFQIVK